METVLEILKITLPALLVLLTAYFVISKTLKNDQDRRRQETALQNVKVITPVRLQAYERVVLLLERIAPESLIMRVSKPDITAQQMHILLINTIRNEYEHNLSQQIYMSNEAWQMVNNARVTVTKMINNVAIQIPPTATGNELSRQILEEMIEMENDPCRTAIEFIKKEVARVM